MTPPVYQRLLASQRIKHRAYGVHLGGEDLETTDWRRFRRRGCARGVSTHDMEIGIALAAKRFLYRTRPRLFRRKPSRCLPPTGAGAVGQSYCRRLADYPASIGSGGISLERAPAVLATGVGSVAVVNAITQAADWRAATHRAVTQILRELAMNDRDLCAAATAKSCSGDIAIEGQQKLLASHVLIVGLSGLGSLPRCIWQEQASAH